MRRLVTIFPEMFDGPLSASMLGIARERGLLDVRVHDLRDWTEGVAPPDRRLLATAADRAWS